MVEADIDSKLILERDTQSTACFGAVVEMGNEKAANGAVENCTHIATFTGSNVIIEVLVGLAPGNIALARLVP